VIFRWESAPFQPSRNGQVCDVTGVGRLYARRLSPRARKFIGLVNGSYAIIEVDTIAEAKAALEKVALRKLAAMGVEQCSSTDT
jgi:hypothetical protein